MPPPLRAPDVEAACILALRLAGLTARDTLLPPYPALRLVRIGGTRTRVADSALIQLDAVGDAAIGKAQTLARWEAAVMSLRAAEGGTFADVVLSAVQVLGGPAYTPELADGAPRYVGTLIVTSRASIPQPA